MARRVAPVRGQQLFQRTEDFEPVAKELATAQAQYLTGVEKNLQRSYNDALVQYEQGAITDRNFSNIVDTMVSNITDPNLRVEWQKVAQEAKYNILVNSQEIEDIRIRSGLASGELSPQDAINRYKAMSTAAMGFDSRSAVRDAETWNLKASMIQESLKRSSGSGSRSGPSTGPLTAKQAREAERMYYVKKAELDAASEQMQADIASVTAAKNAGEISQSDATEMANLLKDNFAKAVQDFATNKSVNTYIFDADGGSAAMIYLNHHLGYLKQMGPGYDIPSYYQEKLNPMAQYTADELRVMGGGEPLSKTISDTAPTTSRSSWGDNKTSLISLLGGKLYDVASRVASEAEAEGERLSEGKTSSRLASAMSFGLLKSTRDREERESTGTVTSVPRYNPVSPEAERRANPIDTGLSRVARQ